MTNPGAHSPGLLTSNQSYTCKSGHVNAMRLPSPLTHTFLPHSSSPSLKDHRAWRSGEKEQTMIPNHIQSNFFFWAFLSFVL